MASALSALSDISPLNLAAWPHSCPSSAAKEPPGRPQNPRPPALPDPPNPPPEPTIAGRQPMGRKLRSNQIKANQAMKFGLVAAPPARAAMTGPRHRLPSAALPAPRPTVCNRIIARPPGFVYCGGMLLWNRWTCRLGAVFLGLLLAGCSLPGDGQPDDEKEPHFVLGKGRVNALDYTGAASAFKEALEVNPRSAAAHFQLAWLYENQLADPAAAIYHYQEYLALSPKARNREVILQHVYACKQQLTKDVMQLPSAPAAQQQIEKLGEQNRKMQEELDKWHAYYNAQLAARPAPATPASRPGTAPAGSSTPDDSTPGPVPLPTLRQSYPTPLVPTRAIPAPMPKQRTHVVASGETLASIARHAGVSLAALQTANPGLNPKHLRTGQTLYLPAP